MNHSISTTSRLLGAAIGALLMSWAGSAGAQALAIEPVTVQLAPGQMTATLTVANQSDGETSFQIRAFAWDDQTGTDQLVPTDAVMTSPPLGTIAAGASQVVRVVLRDPPQGKETTYRIWLDQLPPVAEPGVVRIALRFSIPVFAEPGTRVAPDMQWRIERDNGQDYLVAANSGTRHETIRNVALTAADGRVLKTEENVSPYVLAGATRRWRILPSIVAPAAGVSLRLTASTDDGGIDQPVAVVATP